MPRLILIILLFSNLIVEAQRPDLYPITDYTKCYTGFKNRKGDTIWQPQFEKAFQVYHYSWNNAQWGGWIVKLNNKFGVIDTEGKMTVKPQYESLEQVSESAKYLIARSDDKFSIITTKGEVIQPFKEGDLWTDAGEYFFYEGGKTGMFNRSFGVKIPPVYDDIEVGESEIEYWTDSFYYDRYYVRYYWVNDALGALGLCDSTGKEIIPTKYHNISPITYRSKCLKEHEFFQVEFMDKYGIVNRSGKEVVPLKFEQLYYHNFIQGSCEKKVHEFAIGNYDDGKKRICQAFNLRTGEVSEIYEELTPFDRFFIYKNKKEYGLLDEHFKPVLKELELNLSSYKRNGMDGRENLTSIDNVLFLEHPYTTKRRRLKKIRIHNDHIGLINFLTGKSIDPKYDVIEIRKENKEVYYWAKSYQEIGERIKLDIYDEQMQLITTHHFGDEIHLEQPYYDCRKYEWEYLFSKSGKVGRINAKGDVIIPFNYEFIGELGDRKCKGSTVQLQKDSLNGVFKLTGEKVIPCQYDWLGKTSHGNYIGIKDDKYTALNENGEVLYKGKDLILDRALLNYNRREVEEMIGFYYYPKITWYIIDRDTLYVEKDSSLVKMDSTRIRFDGNLATVHNVLINKYGKVILHGTSYISFAGKYAIVQSREDTKILDQDGSVLMELEGRVGVNIYGRLLRINLARGKMGLYDPISKKWTISPEYMSIMPASELSDELFFVMNSRGQSYQIMDVNGGLVIDQTFDRVFRFPYNQDITLIKSEESYGLIDRDLNVILKPEYEAIYKHDGIYWLLQSGDWGAFDPKGGRLLKPQFEDVSYAKGYNQKVVFVDWNTIAVLDNKLNYLVEPISIDSLLSKGLRSTLKMGGVIRYPGFSRNLYSEKDTLGIGKSINNRLVLEMLRSNSFENVWPLRLGEMGLIDAYEKRPTYNVNQANHVYRATRKQIHPQFYRGKYYSEIEIDLDYRLPGHKVIPETGYFDSHPSRDYAYNNYKFVGGELKSIDLKDLFKPTSGYVPFIEEKLIAIMNKKQAYGTSCVNLVAVLNDLKNHFLIVNEGIRFYNSSNNKYYTISYKELAPYLKEPLR